MAGKKKVPLRLKKYRMDAGYSIYNLAEMMGVNYSTISYWENGVRFPRKEKLILLEDLFHRGYRDLFEELSEVEAKETERRLKENQTRGTTI